METSNNLNNTAAKRYVNIAASLTLDGIAKAVAELEAIANPDYFAYSEQYREERISACLSNLREMVQSASGRSLEFCADGGILRLFWCYNIDGVEVYCLQRVIYPEGTVI